MIKLDGEQGGGQILRTALSLSMLTGEAFHIKNIRGKRRKGGLKRQHLTCVQAAAQITDAATDGAEINSTELIFNPSTITPGDYHFRIGTAGSTTLLAQTLIPALLRADKPSTLVLEGGTHNPLAPTACFIQQAFLPQLKHMGADVSLELLQHGFAPAGGGRIKITISPCKKLQPLHLTERGSELSRQITCHLAHVSESVAGREFKAVCKALQWDKETDDFTRNTVDASDSSGPGNCLSVAINFQNVTEFATSHGAYGKSSERVAKAASKTINHYLSTGAVVGHHLADQLLLPMALAGEGSMITSPPSNHVLTNIQVIEAFLDTSVTITSLENGLHMVSIIT